MSIKDSPKCMEEGLDIVNQRGVLFSKGRCPFQHLTLQHGNDVSHLGLLWNIVGRTETGTGWGIDWWTHNIVARRWRNLVRDNWNSNRHPGQKGLKYFTYFRSGEASLVESMAGIYFQDLAAVTVWSRDQRGSCNADWQMKIKFAVLKGLNSSRSISKQRVKGRQTLA